jgi:hypothetical protein
MPHFAHDLEKNPAGAAGVIVGGLQCDVHAIDAAAAAA